MTMIVYTQLVLLFGVIMRTLPTSTTSQLYGYSIETNLGFISSHVVAGANIFRDVLAAFSDTFGGRSGAYQSKLESIKQDAIEELSKKAMSKGGNGIVGLSIDVDEISGGNKSMLMITASGTAVRCLQNEDSISEVTDPTDYKLVTGNAIRRELSQSRYLSNMKSDAFSLSKEFIEEVSRLELHGLHKEMIRHIQIELRSNRIYEPNMSGWAAVVAMYFSTFNSEVAKDIIYSHLGQDNRLDNFLILVIAELGLLDYERVESMMEMRSAHMSTSIVGLVSLQKEEYTSDDVVRLQRIYDQFNTLENNQFESYTVKSTFGSKEVYKCHCRQEVQVKENQCPSCLRTRSGFTEQKFKYAKVDMENLLAVLNKLFDR